MHDLALVLHSWVRWAAIIAGVLATAAAFSSSDRSTRRWARIFPIVIDVPFLLGLTLFLTPRSGMRDDRPLFRL
jgi:hypothetical protein